MTTAFERYTEQGTDIDQYIDAMENNRDQFLKNIDETRIDQHHFEHFADESVKFLVITEDWCIDSVQFIPALIQVVRKSPNLEIKVLRRDEHKDLASNYRRKDGYQAIPVIVIFDEHGNELGSLVERPEQASAEMAEETRQFQEANPELDGIRRNIDRMPEETREQVKAHIREWRLPLQDRFADYLLSELREIIETGRKAQAA